MFKERAYSPANAYFMKGICPKVSETHGVGIFASEDIKKHEIFEVSPVLVYTPAIFNVYKNEASGGVQHILEHYVFWWDHGKCITAWGCASLYNHANGEKSNASFRMRRTDSPAIEIFATRNIKKDEEIFLHYVHHKFDLEFSPTGQWWASHESDMSSAIVGYDISAAKLLSDEKLGKNSRKNNK